MAEKNDGGDKTEKPTAKRLKDARKRGEVPKSKDLTAVVVLIGWASLIALLWPFILTTLAHPLALAVEFSSKPSVYAMKSIGVAAGWAMTVTLLALFGPIVALAMLTEFAQAGPVLTADRMTPKFDRLNPGEGLKRMFSTDNLVEVVKSLVKALLVAGLVWVVVAGRFQDLTALAHGGPDGMMAALGAMLRDLFLSVAVVFVLVAATDVAYQRFSFTKKMRMSRRDIRQEHKDSEGDPFVRRHRKQLHQEWSGRTAVEATRTAAAVVVNPTHIAVALDYDPELHPAPVVAAKGLGAIAQAMREAAEDEGVPVVRNVEVARALNIRGTLNDVVPTDMFAAVAEVIVWARRMQTETDARRANIDA